MTQIEKVKKDTGSFWLGLKKVFVVTIAVIESLAWLGLLVAAGGWLIYHTLKGNLNLSDTHFWIVVLSVAIISIRAANELRKYMIDIGKKEAGIK